MLHPDSPHPFDDASEIYHRQLDAEWWPEAELLLGLFERLLEGRDPRLLELVLPMVVAVAMDRLEEAGDENG